MLLLHRQIPTISNIVFGTQAKRQLNKSYANIRQYSPRTHQNYFTMGKNYDKMGQMQILYTTKFRERYLNQLHG